MLNDILDDPARQVDRREVIFIGLAFFFLLLLSLNLSLATAARLGSWDLVGDRWAHWSVLPLWLLGYFILRRSLRRSNPHRDPLLLPIPWLFMGWGMLTIWRLDQGFGIRQLGWFVLSTSVLYFLLSYGKDLSWIRRYRYLWVSLGLILMALTLIFGSHPGGGSPRLWLGCCGFYFQPSEGLRFLLIAFLASYLADRIPFDALRGGTGVLRTWLPLILVWALSFALLIIQRDLGTGMLFLALLMMLLYLVLDRWEVPFAALVLGVVGVGVGYLLFDVVALRVQAWLNPWIDPLGGAYQVIQSLITVASGGLFGRGIGMGSPGFVPAIHTDFIFTAMIEEHGLLSGLVIMGLWAIWTSRVLSGVLSHRDPFPALLIAGLGISLGMQALLIIGGNLRLFPLVGITLPYFSYGGSSLLVSSVSLGILLLLSQPRIISDRFLPPWQRIHTGMLVGWGIAALFLGWWTLVRSPALAARGDNPRWAIDSRYSKRGMITDRNGEILAESIGLVGAYTRTYPHPEAASLVGYDVFPYGQTGLEEVMDGVLRGVTLQNEWDVIWTNLTRGVTPKGGDIRLTLDINLQRTVLELMLEQRGVVLVLDADNGDIVSAVSVPTFNPNTLEDQWSEILTNPDSPLLNRAIQGQYQPGSALAPFIMAWALDQELATLHSPVEDLTEVIEINGDQISCTREPSGIVDPDFRDALAYGCPRPFQELLLELGDQAYVDVLNQFGLNQSADQELQGEFEAVTRPESAEDLAMAAIGQGELTLNPLQLVRAIAAIVGEGQLPGVRVVDAIRGVEESWERFEDLDNHQAAIKPDTAAEIRSVLTSENIVSYQGKALAGEPIGWYLGGVRSLAGNYAIVVVIENGEPGVAASVGQALLEELASRALP